MTPADHNKVIGIMHLIYGGFFTLVAFLALIFMGFVAEMFRRVGATDPSAPPAEFFWLIAIFIFFIYLVMSLPSLIAGYAMLKKKSWARLAGIIAAVLSAMSFPFGTALCVYTLWFLFGDAGKAFERGLGEPAWQGTLGPGRPNGDYARTSGHEREPAYRPPAEPPDWRNG